MSRRLQERAPLLGARGAPATHRHTVPDTPGGKAEEANIHPIITRIRRDMMTLIDTPLSTEQLTSPAITFSITRPLENKYFDLHNEAIIFALLINRVQFVSDQSHAISLHSVNATRALLCEILATNLLRRIHEYDLLKECGSLSTNGLDPVGESAALLKSANLLAKAFNPFQGATQETIESLRRFLGEEDVLSMRTNAVEMAIIGEAKQFIRSPACQRVIDGIWTGRIVYSSSSNIDIIPDLYKRRPVSIYDPRKASLLNHYRLTVPRIRSYLEQFHYAVLVVSYIMTLQTRQLDHLNGWEVWFIVYITGFGIEKLASVMEHGWRIYLANLWNGLDTVFLLIYILYFILRMIGIHQAHITPPWSDRNSWANEQSHQVLACAAVLIFPRLAFNMLSDNILVLSLRAMLSDFVFLMCLAVWCFLGFGYALWSLGERKYQPQTIGLWMAYVFWGLDGSGLGHAQSFHPTLGPVIFFVYASLSNTLLVTVLVSILSKIFADISNDATAETLYRRTVLTFEGVKSDAVFNYQPPINILAVIFLVPLRLVLTPRKFHSVHVFCTRVTNAPLLLLITWYERQTLNSPSSVGSRGAGRMSTRISRNLNKFGVHSMIHATFECGVDHDLRPGGESFEEEDYAEVLRLGSTGTVGGKRVRNAVEGNGTVRAEDGTERPRKSAQQRRKQRAHSQPGGARHYQSALARLFVPQAVLGGGDDFLSAQRSRSFSCQGSSESSSPTPTPPTVDLNPSGLTLREPRDRTTSARGERSVSASRPASIIQSERADGNDADWIASVEERLQRMETNWKARMDRLDDGQKRIESLLKRLHD